jgi:hypothetical protein
MSIENPKIKKPESKEGKRKKKNPFIAEALITAMLLFPQIGVSKDKKVEGYKEEYKIEQVDEKSAKEARKRFEELKKRVKSIQSDDIKPEEEKVLKKYYEAKRIIRSFELEEILRNSLGKMGEKIIVRVGGAFQENIKVYYKDKNGKIKYLDNAIPYDSLKFTPRQLIIKVADMLYLKDIIDKEERIGLEPTLIVGNEVRSKMKSMGLSFERRKANGIVKFEKSGKGFEWDSNTYQITTEIIPNGIRFLVKDYDGSKGKVIFMEDGSVEIGEMKKK